MSVDIDTLIAKLEKMDSIPPAQPKPDTTYIDHIFRDVFAQKFPGYEAREPQIRLAKLVAEGLATGQCVIAEAGTGTGKSYAVLVPAIHHAAVEHRGRVLVSTATIALQEQYIQKDIPFLGEALGTLGIRFSAALAKGKANYLCLARLDDELRQQALVQDEDLARIAAWARSTATGDVAELPGNPGSVWTRVCADDSCAGLKCPQADRCFYYRAKAAWREADLIVCNHKLLLSHLAAGGRILPEYSAVILDEAHHLEAEALDVFGVEISNYRVPALLNEVKRLGGGADLATASQDARNINDAFFATLAASQKGEKARVERMPGEAEPLIKCLVGLKGHIAAVDSDKAEVLGNRAENVAVDLQAAADALQGSGGYVVWAEVVRDSNRVVLHATPPDVATELRGALFDQVPVVMTSATLAAGGRFDYLRRSVGCDEALELQVPAPFDYPNQGLLYIPRDLPDPRSADYYPRITPLIEEILLRTNGRAFVLFTSYRGMNEVYRNLAGRLRWTALRQGDRPKGQLIEEFRRDVHSVLFATATFWEGVDVTGEALSCVIIDKLPFPTPGDPVVEAKCLAIKRSGGSDFFDYMVPDACLKLRQGVGRLIRTRRDRGLVAILDSRIRTKGYGAIFLRSLPPFKQISSLENVELFLK